MASTREFVEFICSQLATLGEITYRPMMGEYLVYVDGKYCVAVCDNQMFVKPTEKAKLLLKEIIEAPMYEGAKPSFLITNVDDKEYLCEIVKATYDALPAPKVKKKKR